MPLLLS